ncbi:MAG TPA: rod shape-determining protein MreC [Burkholderiales bacterium]|jgi:rod shape-determining protein MreC|nr:rod shape-determining protein MreC [Burkholderiales bacterium]
MEHTPPPFFKRGPSLLTRLTFFSLLSIVLLYSDARFRYLEDVRRAVAVVLYPLQRLAHVPGEVAGRISGFFVTHSALRRENERLKHENFVNSGQLQAYQALAAENDHLRALMQLRGRIERPSQVAEILYAARDPFVRRVVLDKGSTHGVELGAAVVGDAGLVGQVQRVFPWAAEVSLVTDRDQVIPVQVVRNGLRGVLFGLGYDGALDLRFLPVNADIQSGDLLVTSGIDGTYPPGLPVATVANIERNAAYPFARVLCTPSAAVNSHRQLLVLAKGPPLPERLPAADAPKARKTQRAAQ